MSMKINEIIYYEPDQEAGINTHAEPQLPLPSLVDRI